jgi:uncharacterized protein YraI
MGRRAFAFAALFVLLTPALHAQDLQFTVTHASVDVYKSPSTGSPVIGKAMRGRVLEVTRELGSWVKIAWPDAQDGIGYLHVTFGTVSRANAPEANRTASATADPTTAAAAAATTSTARISQRPGPSTLSRSTISLPSHNLGVGARLGTRALGFAATGRAWSRGPIGVQLEIGRATYSSAFLTERVSAMQMAPSVIFSLPDLVSNALWARPYVGSGLNIYRSTLKSGSAGVSNVVDSGLGAQFLGGAEFTAASFPQLALSADVRHAWAPTPFSGFEMGGFGFSVSAHWYVR